MRTDVEIASSLTGRGLDANARYLIADVVLAIGSGDEDEVFSAVSALAEYCEPLPDPRVWYGNTVEITGEDGRIVPGWNGKDAL